MGKNLPSEQLEMQKTVNLPDVDRGRSKGIPIEKVIELHQKGLNQVEIAKFFGCTKQAICQRIAPYKDDLEGLQAFKFNRADVLAFHERRILNRLTNDDIQKASGYQKVGMFSLLYDKERLERGETTQNIGYADYSKALGQVMKERERLAAELGLNEDESVIDA